MKHRIDEREAPNAMDARPSESPESPEPPESSPEREPPSPRDDDHADPTLIQWMLDRSPEQRLDALQGFVDSIWELRGGHKA